MRNTLAINTLIFGTLTLALPAASDTALIGLNLPEASLLDGDFNLVRNASWRKYKQTPHWTSKAVEGNRKVGLSADRISSGGNAVATYDSPILDHTACKKLSAGDILTWRFAANAEYECDGRVSLGLVFGDTEKLLADRVRVPTGPAEPEVYEGQYVVTEKDAASGMPSARFTLRSDHAINVYVDYVDLRVRSAGDPATPHPSAQTAQDSTTLTWADTGNAHHVYRSDNARGPYFRVAQAVQAPHWTDRNVVSGKTYHYALKRADDAHAAASETVPARHVDRIPPAEPVQLRAAGQPWTVRLTWQTSDPDTASYTVLRGDADGKNLQPIASGITKTTYTDDLPPKGVTSSYAVQAVDFSGNTGSTSIIASAQPTLVRGASFSDLLRPMPITHPLRDDLWGTDAVRPRNANNGIEHPDWSYWGGRPVRDADGRYHMLVVRWPEGDRRGHWAWPDSTTVHTVSDHPTGPYVATNDRAYDHARGLGHNADVTVLNDGRFLLYSLIKWKPTLLTADTMQGPWTVEGEMSIDYDEDKLDDPREYQVQRNLSGVQLDDGNMLFVTKFGRMIKSTDGLLGPYQVLTDVIQNNPTVPKKYRSSGYEDPVMWRDGVQFHMIINAFLDYRAIYLRSPDGVNWIYDDGLAYTPQSTAYEDGTRPRWYKLERPHVLQDEYGRATHLSLAATDVAKRLDFANDGHSAKNLIIPLTPHKRMTLLDEAPAGAAPGSVAVLVRSEEAFDAADDLDLASLRLGPPTEVNRGRGGTLTHTTPHPDGLVLVVEGADTGLVGDDFVYKLIGQTKSGELVVAFCRLAGK